VEGALDPDVLHGKLNVEKEGSVLLVPKFKQESSIRALLRPSFYDVIFVHKDEPPLELGFKFDLL